MEEKIEIKKIKNEGKGNKRFKVRIGEKVKGKIIERKNGGERDEL